MNELKTLKDLTKEILDKHKWNTPCLTFEGNLRQEAIKWCKSIMEYALAGDGDIKCYIGQIGFIKVFFNLSEDDLK